MKQMEGKMQTGLERENDTKSQGWCWTVIPHYITLEMINGNHQITLVWLLKLSLVLF